MKRMLKPGSFNLYRELPKESGCRACQHNEQGICVLSNKEVPLTCSVKNSRPKWCQEK